jgi:hypothetical protein
MAHKQMEAAVDRAFREPLVIEELPILRPEPNQILVPTEARRVRGGHGCGWTGAPGNPICESYGLARGSGGCAGR